MKRAIEKKKFFKYKIPSFLSVDKIVTIHYQEIEKNYVSKEEKHDFWEIIYADKKNVCVVKDGKRTLLKQGEMIFIKPNQAHHVEGLGEEPNIFIISFDCHSHSIAFFKDKQYSVPDAYRYLLQNVMTEAVETFNLPDFDPDLDRLQLKDSPNLGGSQVLKNQLELLLIYMLRQAQHQSSSPEFFVSKITASDDLQDKIVCFLSSKIYDSLSLDELCAQLHYGKTRLCSLFKEKTGTSIYQTYLRLKIDEAKKLIRRNQPFTEIAAKLSFDSVSHFSYVFKKHTGMTPSEYKSSIKQS